MAEDKKKAKSPKQSAPAQSVNPTDKQVSSKQAAPQNQKAGKTPATGFLIYPRQPGAAQKLFEAIQAARKAEEETPPAPDAEANDKQPDKDNPKDAPKDAPSAQ